MSGQQLGGAGEGEATAMRVRLEIDRGVFMISVAAELANMHPQTLRTYEARGLIAPHRSPKGTRLYSQGDVERLRRIQEMTAELGLNLAGVERVLALEAEVHDMNRRVEELEVQALATELRLAEELEAVRRSFRAELVPYRGAGRTGTEMVLASEAQPLLRRRRAGGERSRGGPAPENEHDAG
ncbi:MAG: heat shock protein transcriptional repressor HspR [Solirubrobacteraceae bacterium]